MEMGKATKLTSNEIDERCWSERSGRNGRDEVTSYGERRHQIGHRAKLVQASLPRYASSNLLASLEPGSFVIDTCLHEDSLGLAERPSNLRLSSF